ILNRQVKFRERWRPFCPSILAEYADEFIQTGHNAETMSISFPVAQKWREKTPSVVYKDGTSRVQVVSRNHNARFYQVLKYFNEITGTPLVINTTLNRPGEALVASPEDALNMFLGSDLNYLIMEDLLVTKRAEPEHW
ncbi:MAG: carbamoyltransferase C-terminal domain-containing protein, partial [Pseudohongiellaceae bacterium]